MDLKRIIFLVIVGGVLCALSVLTALAGWAVITPMVVILILAAIVVILLVRDLKRWIESLVDRITAGDPKHREELARISTSLESVKATVARIEERMDTQDR